jgi:hypothetical protein
LGKVWIFWRSLAESNRSLHRERDKNPSKAVYRNIKTSIYPRITGFVFAKLFSGKQTPTSPALGTIMNIRRVPAWNVGDNPTLPPPQRDTLEEWRPSGYSYDPRIAIIKDTPGPLEIQEIPMEISI